MSPLGGKADIRTEDGNGDFLRLKQGLHSTLETTRPMPGRIARMRPLGRARHFHDENGDYGISTFFWDKLFGTHYDRPERPEKPVLSPPKGGRRCSTLGTRRRWRSAGRTWRG
jgi:hypothetical protein